MPVDRNLQRSQRLSPSMRGVLPIVQLDDHAIGDGMVGLARRDLMARCRAEVFGD